MEESVPARRVTLTWYIVTDFLIATSIADVNNIELKKCLYSIVIIIVERASNSESIILSRTVSRS